MSNPILDRFERRELAPETVETLADNSRKFREFAEEVLTMAPAGRELALALTALQEAKFWTNEAVASAYGYVTEPDETAAGDEPTDEPTEEPADA
ncbi:hypothetical protein HQQ88_08210 [Curtobacterium sp. VKM Ac-2861]|uniref:Acb2/Tad1 domain-containing protein n=1 Tax=Curtobacterium sp. VKM Ac-2861 TaxID=2739016 RepID=UPI001566B54D|nr:hypothetical protein [Curtobacterium sp. VKM Ac-2861]